MMADDLQMFPGGLNPAEPEDQYGRGPSSDAAELLRKKRLENLAKARAARAAKAAAFDPLAPRPKRAYHKSRKVKARRAFNELAAKPAKPKKEAATDVNLEGMRHAKMGTHGCPIACTPATGCILTLGGVCAHPDLGGPQPAYRENPEILRRDALARLYLKKLDAETGR
jgi:hypothetical protein